MLRENPEPSYTPDPTASDLCVHTQAVSRPQSGDGVIHALKLDAINWAGLYLEPAGDALGSEVQERWRQHDPNLNCTLASGSLRPRIV